MIKILKRLELIKTAITIEDEEIIELQIQKLKTYDIDAEVASILNYLASNGYADALAQIDIYVQKYSGMVVYEDKEVNALKLELKVLEHKLQEMSEKKNEYLNDINEFNVEYSLHLGELIRNILKLKEELLQKKVKEKQESFKETKKEYEDLKQEVNDLERHLEELDEFDDAYDEVYEELQDRKEQLNAKRKETKQAKEALEEDESFQAYEEVKEDYKEFNKEYEEVVSQERFELNEEEQKELKKLFRQASRLCHPDIVTDELKDQAHKIMAQLNEAYKQKDLQQVKKVLASLESGIVFEVASDKINDSEVLKAKILDIREKIDDMKSELEEIQDDDTFKTLQNIDNLDTYFETMKEQLQIQYDSLHGLEEEKKESPKEDPLKKERSLFDEEDDYWESAF